VFVRQGLLSKLVTAWRVSAVVHGSWHSHSLLCSSVQLCVLVLPAGRPGLAHGGLQGCPLCRSSAAGVLCTSAVPVQHTGAGRRGEGGRKGGGGGQVVGSTGTAPDKPPSAKLLQAGAAAGLVQK
jgi:hypothetical protein